MKAILDFYEKIFQGQSSLVQGKTLQFKNKTTQKSETSASNSRDLCIEKHFPSTSQQRNTPAPNSNAVVSVQSIHHALTSARMWRSANWKPNSWGRKRRLHQRMPSSWWKPPKEERDGSLKACGQGYQVNRDRVQNFELNRTTNDPLFLERPSLISLGVFVQLANVQEVKVKLK